jgi:glucose-1-phosphate thymidylyltransferase
MNSDVEFINPVILAGGSGSRLGNLTKATNKHLLPYKNGVVIDSVFKLASSQGTPLVITNPESVGSIASYLGTKAYYGVQEKPLGIADAIKVAKSFCIEDGIAVILGDNYFCENAAHQIKITMDTFTSGCSVFVKEVNNPKHYGVMHINDKGNWVAKEKPKNPKSNLALTGAYVFDSQIWDILPKLKPSKRGEYEVTDIINAYPEKDLDVVKLRGDWKDLGKSVKHYWKQGQL